MVRGELFHRGGAKTTLFWVMGTFCFQTGQWDIWKQSYFKGIIQWLFFYESPTDKIQSLGEQPQLQNTKSNVQLSAISIAAYFSVISMHIQYVIQPIQCQLLFLCNSTTFQSSMGRGAELGDSGSERGYIRMEVVTKVESLLVVIHIAESGYKYPS